MRNRPVTIQFCGFGGQGIVLTSAVLGTAAVTRARLRAVQTQSYGSEARGGECQAELMLSDEPICSPLADEVNILVALSQTALDRYLGRLKPGGTLVIDPALVARPSVPGIRVFEVPATSMAEECGAKIAANMVMLGFLQAATGLVSADDLRATIAEQVPTWFLEVDLKAAERGTAFAQANDARVEV